MNDWSPDTFSLRGQFSSLVVSRGTKFGKGDGYWQQVIDLASHLKRMLVRSQSGGRENDSENRTSHGV